MIDWAEVGDALTRAPFGAVLDAIIDSAPVVVVAFDRDGVVSFARGEPLTKLGLAPDEILGENGFELFEALRPDITALVRRVLAGAELQTTIEWADDVLDVWFRPLRDDGDVIGGLAIGTIVTDRARAEREQWHVLGTQRQRERQQAAVARLGQEALDGTEFAALCHRACELLVGGLDTVDAAVLLDDGHPEGLLVVAGTGWARDHVGHARVGRGSDTPIAYVTGRSEPVCSDDIYADDRFGAPTPLDQAVVRSAMAISIGTRGGAIGVLLVSRATVAPFNERDTSFLQSMANVLGSAYDAERSADELRHSALHDSLTGLPNRTLLTDRLERAIESARAGGRRVGVIVCDLDRFKLVNDSRGHPLGDELLTAVAQRLRDVVRPGDTVARFGGDEFVVVCSDIEDESTIVRVAERLAATFTEPVLIGGESIFTSASMGIAVGDADAAADDLLRDADAAMYRAKDEGRGRWEVFDDVLRARAHHRLDTETALRRALRNDELALHYQPIVSVGNGRLLGVEALVRWCHPDRGLLTPLDFVPIAEESGLIRDIGQWVLCEAARQTAEWTNAGLWEHRSTSVNVAAAQMDEELPFRVAAAAGEAGLDPGKLRVEITETVLLRDTKAAELVLRDLRAMGVRASVDDFGTGYSSLAYLAELSVDTLKIDRAFVQGLVTTPAGRAITEAVTKLAHSLRMSAVAEGVETTAQVDALRGLGCDAMQGFLIGRPLDAASVTALLTR